MGLKPFVEPGFTPDAMKTSEQTPFYWKGNTSRPLRRPATAAFDWLSMNAGFWAVG